MSDRLALIIANSEFDDPKLSRLKTPGRDAEALAEVLSDPAIGGFEVTPLVDETEPVLRRKIAHLYHRRRRGDLLLLYYSGHGIRDEGALYLATRDTEMDFVGATALSAAFLRRQIDRSGSQRKVVILDCCHSGAFAGAKAGLGGSAGTEEAFAGSGYGRVILTASNAVEYAWEGDKLLGEATESVFTHFLVQGLRTGAADLNGDGRISLDELYDYVYEQVVTSGLTRQTPQKWAQKVEGRIIIARSPAPEVSLPGWVTAALASTAYSARLAAVGELAQLSRGQDKALAAAARAELERLSREDENPAVRGAAAGALGVPPVIVPARQPPTVVAEKPEPRPDLLTITSPIHLELVRVPAGEFLMGSDPAKDEDAHDGEQPQHTVHLSEFYIGKYPVTNAQYAAFVRATKHRAPELWKKGEIPSGEENHPVIYVSWRDAIAFCEWLSRETGENFRLPTEAEWEKAARGADGRIYPWGDGPPTAGLCNFDANVGDTTPVGRYSPQGDSPYGCADMAGNVWEWCSSLYEPYPYDPGDGRENLVVGGSRVLRGGSWYGGQVNARCAYRGRARPGDWGVNVGFRCARGSP
ncbi:MAG: SUMF1/EgtB/PvdO family nonheme iron enzyme [Anaerolineae bacterium]